VRKRAFTLLELMVACALLTLLLTVLLSVVSQSNNLWQQASNANIRRQASRIAQEMMSRDLGQLLYSPLRSAEIQCIASPAWIDENTRNPDSIFWIANVPHRAGEGAGGVSGIGYFIQWITTSEGPRAYLLRYRVPFTQSVVQAVEKDPKSWISPDAISQMLGDGDSGSLRGVVAENVIGLWVRFYDADGVEIARTPGAAAEPAKDLVPRQIEIEIAVLEPFAARRLQTADLITRCYPVPSAQAFCGLLPAEISRSVTVVRCRAAVQIEK